MRNRTLIFIILAIAAVAAAAEIFKWVDDQGVTHYGEVKPEGEQAETLELPPEPPTEQLKEAQEKWRTDLQQKRKNEEPQKVFGTIAIGFVPSGLSVLPDQPRKMTLIVKKDPRKKESQHPLNDPDPDWIVEGSKTGRSARIHQNFELNLPPGAYRVVGVEIESRSLSKRPIELPLDGHKFEVPIGQCAYVGRMAYFFQILSPGSLSQATEMAGSVAREIGSPVVMVYLPKGSLVLTTRAFDKPKDNLDDHDRIILQKAIDEGCLIN
ncbi:MAG: DUF4124 domain-containing protein [Sedimenticolaceae bacterium]